MNREQAKVLQKSNDILEASKQTVQATAHELYAAIILGNHNKIEKARFNAVEAYSLQLQCLIDFNLLNVKFNAGV